MTNTDMPRPPGAELVPTPSVTKRRTRQRDLIASVLAGSDQIMTSQQIHNRLSQQGQSVGLATVYRTLAAMQLAGEVDAVRIGQELAYRRCSQTHHHHLTCRSCGNTIEIMAPLERWAESVAAEHGFTGIEHVIEISGLCPSCQ